jgi:hypothetical protein
MMPSAHAAEQLVAAHSEVKRACDLLIASSPEALDRCQGALQQAVSDLAAFRKENTEVAASGARPVALELRREIMRAARLLQSLAGFYQGWESILGAMTAGYTASGDAAPVARQGRFCCRG